MHKRTVEEIMLPLSDYAVVEEDATIRDALEALKESQEKLPPDRQPHRAILVKDRSGKIIGKLHHFAFLRALVPERRPRGSIDWMDRAGVEEDLWDSSLKTLDFLTADLVDVCQRARHMVVRDVFTPTRVSISSNAPLSDAILAFLSYQTLSLLVTQAGKTVGILRLSDLFEELAAQIMGDTCTQERNSAS